MRTDSEEDGATQFFRSAVDDYDALHYGQRSLMSVRLERVGAAIRRLKLAAGSPALDVGCGPGHLVAEFALQGFDAYGVDTSGPMLARAKRRFSEAGRNPTPLLQLARAEHLPFFDGAFDLVCSTGMIEYLPADGPVLAEFFRVLRPDGQLILTITNAWSPAGLLDGLVEWSKRQEWLLAPFNRVWVARGNPPVRPRPFGIRRHRPARIRRNLVDAGFEVVDSEFFYMLPWPHPFDRLFPSTTAALGKRLERFTGGPMGILAEGLLVTAKKACAA